MCVLHLIQQGCFSFRRRACKFRCLSISQHTQNCFFLTSTKTRFFLFYFHQSCMIEAVSYYQGILTDRSRQFKRPTLILSPPPPRDAFEIRKEPVPKEGAVAAVFRTLRLLLVALSRKIPLLALAFSHGQCV